MARLETMIRSRPHRVVFAGFESTTARLQQAGWQLSAEEDFVRGEVRLAMRFAPADLYLLADSAHVDYYGRASARMMAPPEPELTFVVRRCAAKMSVVLHETQFSFTPIDAVPQFAEVSPRSLEDFRIFATPLVRTEEIIVEPQSVAECLELIRKLQAPELAEVRKRNARRDGEAINQQQFHAQILSLAAWGA